MSDPLLSTLMDPSNADVFGSHVDVDCCRSILLTLIDDHPQGRLPPTQKKSATLLYLLNCFDSEICPSSKLSEQSMDDSYGFYLEINRKTTQVDPQCIGLLEGKS